MQQKESQFKSLLDVPIHKMFEELSVSAATKFAAEYVSLPFSIHLLSLKIVSREHQVPEKPAQLATATNTALWVDRYRPQRFTELLGDDRVHREVLSWVKEWDCCVFGKNKNRGRKRARADVAGENLDQWRRPREKVSSRLIHTRWHSCNQNVAAVAVGAPRTRENDSSARCGTTRRIQCLRDQRK